MDKSAIQSGRMRMWILAAMSAPLAHFSGCGWVTVLLLSAALLPLCVLPGDGWQNLGKFWCALELVWIVVVMGILLRNSGAYWPSPSRWFVPMVLLALALWGASGDKGARIGTVLAWILLGLFAVVLLAGLAEVELKWIRPTARKWESGLVIALLLPALQGIWNEEEAHVPAGAALAAGAFALFTQGVLSIGASASLETPFYEAARSLTVGGLCWELPASIAMTLGWYVLAVLLSSAGFEMARGCGVPDKWSTALIFAGAGTTMLIDIEADWWIMGIICLIGWILVPFLKTNKKIEKSS